MQYLWLILIWLFKQKAQGAPMWGKVVFKKAVLVQIEVVTQEAE